jgi:hypothetical protein
MEFDVYTDIACPAASEQWFIKVESHQPETDVTLSQMGLSARLFVKGVRPVDTDKSRACSNKFQQIAKPDVYGHQAITYRDDRFGDLDLTLDRRPLQPAGAIERGCSDLRLGSWYDGAAATVIRRFVNFGTADEVVGAWAHNSPSASHAASPSRPCPI